MSLTLSSAGRRLERLEALVGELESVDYAIVDQAYNRIMYRLTDAELETIISCTDYDQLPADFLEKWEDDLETAGRLEYEYLQKWGKDYDAPPLVEVEPSQQGQRSQQGQQGQQLQQPQQPQQLQPPQPAPAPEPPPMPAIPPQESISPEVGEVPTNGNIKIRYVGGMTGFELMTAAGKVKVIKGESYEVTPEIWQNLKEFQPRLWEKI